MAMLSPRQGWSFAVLLVIFPCVFFASSTDEAPPTLYRASASEVRISLFAADQNNRPVENLTKDDFAVIDSGVVIREFRSLTRANETALDVTVLLDVSESMAAGIQPVMQDVARLVSEDQVAPSARISIVTFSGMQPSLLCSGDCRTSAAQQRLVSLGAEGATPLFDALAYTARLISTRQAPGVRQVLILFSDGRDTISITSASAAIDAVIASGALLYTVNPHSGDRVGTGSISLQRMAEATGGRSFPAQENAGDLLRAILTDLRSSYVVTYPLPNRKTGFHSLRILPKHNLNLRFYSRREYYYEEGR